MRKAVAVTIMSLFGLALVLSGSGQAGDKKEAKKETKKDAKEGRKGTTIGVLVKKEKGGIEVLADGEETPRRYVPQWVGNAKGGPDKAVLKTFDSLKIGSRVEVEWLFQERLRAMSIKVLEGPKEKS